jgi:hypothetical protein
MGIIVADASKMATPTIGAAADGLRGARAAHSTPAPRANKIERIQSVLRHLLATAAAARLGKS